MPKHNPTSRGLRLLGLPAVLLAGIAAQPVAAAETAAPRVWQSGHWMAGCDNNAECVTIGVVPDPQAITARFSRYRLAIRIAPDISPSGSPGIELLRVYDGGYAPAGSLKPVAVGFAGTDSSSEANLAGDRLSIANGKAARWLTALAEAKELRISAPEFEAPNTEGFARVAALVTQQRTEIMLNPQLQATPARKRERLRPAVEVMSSGYPAIQLLRTPCPEGSAMNGYRQFMLPGDALLWSLSCSGPKGTSTHWFQSAPRLAMAAPLKLPDDRGPDIDAAKDGLPDSVFDFDFGILRARHGPEGRLDCGVQRAWAWDGREWFLLERRDMPVCAGLAPSDWIRIYRAP